MAIKIDMAKTMVPAALSSGVRPGAHELEDHHRKSDVEARKKQRDDELVPRQREGNAERGDDRRGENRRNDPAHGREISGTQIMGRIVKIAEVIPELRVDDRKTEREIDHDMPDADGEERAPDAKHVEHDQQPEPHDQI